MRSRRDDERGTTLIELLVASAIALTMLGSIAMTTAVIGGQATTLYHGAHAASNAEQLLDSAATQLGNAEQIGVCTQSLCPASTPPPPPSPIFAASATGLCFAAPITSTRSPNTTPVTLSGTTPGTAPEAVCIVTGGTSLTRLYLDLFSPTVSTYVACTSLSSCFGATFQACVASLTQTPTTCGGASVSYYLGVLSGNTSLFTYYNATSTTSSSCPGTSCYYDPTTGYPACTGTSCDTASWLQLSDIKAIQMDVTVSAGYSTGHVPLSYTLDYTAVVH